ncbi:MAG: hypothetical protein OEM40_08820 [Acidimicrobiia bacterium]|nr:hypothetical protein [Acidimicrobiia bacterium]
MRRSVLAILLATAMLGLLATPGAARPNELDVTAEEFVIDVIDPGESRIVGNSWHVRDLTILYRVIGEENPDLATGFNLSVINYNWNLKNGAIHLWGTIDYTLDAYNNESGFAGTFSISIPPNEIAIPGPDFDPADPTTRNCVWDKGIVVAQGYGDLTGAQARWNGASDNCGGVISFEGSIFFPGQ